MRRRIAVVYARPVGVASRDELDTLVQAETVSAALVEQGYRPAVIAVSSPEEAVRLIRRRVRPPLAFNLVEGLAGTGRYIHLVPMLLDFWGIPYTGCPAEAQLLTSNKLLAKAVMRAGGLPTPPWIGLEELEPGRPPFAPPYIVKSVWEHASVGLEESSVYRTYEELPPLREQSAASRAARPPEGRTAAAGRPSSTATFFCEQYIEGREFNLSMLGGQDPPRILPPAEILFPGYGPGRPRIVGYRAKWDEGSEEYRGTPRRFDFPEEDTALLDRLRQLALRCWRLFGLRGYARVDFRVGPGGAIHILEVNANPCLSPEAGFAAAAGRDGLAMKDVVERILRDVPTERAPA